MIRDSGLTTNAIALATDRLHGKVLKPEGNRHTTRYVYVQSSDSGRSLYLLSIGWTAYTLWLRSH